MRLDSLFYVLFMCFGLDWSEGVLNSSNSDIWVWIVRILDGGPTDGFTGISSTYYLSSAKRGLGFDEEITQSNAHLPCIHKHPDPCSFFFLSYGHFSIENCLHSEMVDAWLGEVAHQFCERDETITFLFDSHWGNCLLQINFIDFDF